MTQIGKTLDDMDFQRYVQPAILPIFAMNDRAVRVQLLQVRAACHVARSRRASCLSCSHASQPCLTPVYVQRMDDFIQSMDRETINTQVFEPLLAGFADTAKLLRELTLKSMLSLAEKLSEKNLNDRLVKSLTRLQVRLRPRQMKI